MARCYLCATWKPGSCQVAKRRSAPASVAGRRERRPKMPTTKLTERFLDRVKPDPARQVEWWDKSLPGFGVRVAPGGTRTFTVLYRLHGKLTRRSLGSLPPMRSSDLPSVWERARDILHEVKEGRDPFAPEPGTLTVEGLVKRFLEE